VNLSRTRSESLEIKLNKIEAEAGFLRPSQHDSFEVPVLAITETTTRIDASYQRTGSNVKQQLRAEAWQSRRSLFSALLKWSDWATELDIVEFAAAKAKERCLSGGFERLSAYMSRSLGGRRLITLGVVHHKHRQRRHGFRKWRSCIDTLGLRKAPTLRSPSTICTPNPLRSSSRLPFDSSDSESTSPVRPIMTRQASHSAHTTPVSTPLVTPTRATRSSLFTDFQQLILMLTLTLTLILTLILPLTLTLIRGGAPSRISRLS